MCFSAPASFIVSGGLTVLGIATFKVAPKRKKLLAFIPLTFAIQQALEGYQWIALNQGEVSMSAGYGFLLFAFLFWPVAIPATAYILDVRARTRIRWFLFLGIIVSLWNLSFFVLSGHPLTITSLAGTVVYDVQVGQISSIIITVMYISALCGSLFVSSIKIFRIFGAGIFIAATVAYVWFRAGFPSVWCFFSALLSACVYWYATRHNTRVSSRFDNNRV